GASNDNDCGTPNTTSGTEHTENHRIHSITTKLGSLNHTLIAQALVNSDAMIHTRTDDMEVKSIQYGRLTVEFSDGLQTIVHRRGIIPNLGAVLIMPHKHHKIYYQLNLYTVSDSGSISQPNQISISPPNA
ncbi:hypothetical protein SARC_09067, partial [Sphaeroforma arctica JP610]